MNHNFELTEIYREQNTDLSMSFEVIKSEVPCPSCFCDTRFDGQQYLLILINKG